LTDFLSVAQAASPPHAWSGLYAASPRLLFVNTTRDGGYMDRQHTLELLRRCKPELRARFGVTRLALFGSTARDTANSGSDVDILVAFDGPATSKRYFGVQFYLEDLLGRPVDLVTEKARRPELRPFIDQEMINV
jgi:predicted nucleotidyltransferase